MPRSLSIQTDVVGYPIFHNFDHLPSFWAYRLCVYAFPALTIAFHSVLAWRGPLRRGARVVSRGPIKLVEPASPEPGAPEAPGFRPGLIPRVALPLALVIASAAARTGAYSAFAFMCGFLYVMAILTVAVLWSWVATRSAWVAARTGSPDRRAAFWDGTAFGNGAGGAAAAIVCVWYVSRHTAVITNAVGRLFPWMPLWLGAVAVIAVVGWTLLQIRQRRPARTTEHTLLTVVVGAVAMFLVTSQLPGQTWKFYGFDDAQHMAGASLLNRGYFPWRDLLFIHGLFQDVLRGNIGIAVFEDTIFGVNAGLTVLIIPLCWVCVYLYTAWVSRRNSWLLATLTVAAATSFIPGSDTRFIVMPLALIALGETIRRRSRIWSVGLVLLLFTQAVLVPETSFFAIPALVCLVAADLVHREPGSGLWQALRRTRWCAATGTVALLLFGAFLAYHHALGPFIDYYRVFGSGHNESGAIPPNGLDVIAYLLWGTGAMAVLVTIWVTWARILRRGDWESLDWVALAVAGFVIFYEEKALGRFDGGHINQVFGVALPLILLWIWRGLRAADFTLVIRRSPQASQRSAGSLVVASPALVLLLLVFSGFTPLAATVRYLPGRHQMASSPDPTYPKISYAAPTAVDTALLHDLDISLRAYAGNDQPVFDFTNSLGYLYYLLGREPGTKFAHVSMAIPAYAQQLLISDLKKSRPPVVLFDAPAIGLGPWDEISNDVRHYEVSQYLLDSYAPVLKTHGNMIMVRRDLVRSGMPIPALSEPPVTTDLWFRGPSCAWDTTPNFLTSTAQGKSVQLPLQSMGTQALVNFVGWAADRTGGQTTSSVAVVNGRQVLASFTPSLLRPDVAQALGVAKSTSGFDYSVLAPKDAKLSLYMLSGDGKYHPLNNSTPSGATELEFPDGRVVPTAEAPGGYLETQVAKDRLVAKVDVPSGVNLADYRLATLSAGRQDLGTSDIVITDNVGSGRSGQDDHFISASSLPGMKPDLAIRVGSCPQWHGYDSTKPLYVLQDGGTAVTSVTLSGVRD